MCDEDTAAENERFLGGALSRRRFGQVAIGSALLTMLPATANALDVSGRDVTVTTPDGEMDGYFVHPSKGNWPGVIVWPDIVGLRDAFRTMGRRLAESGYSVLVVNPYYRAARAPVVPAGASFADPATREILLPLARQLTAETTQSDARAFLAFLDSQFSVDSTRGVGTTGYCMGGPMTMWTAATLPARIRAGASFHGARLVTDAPDSPHTMIGQMQARFLVAIAENDDAREPDAKNVLRKAFAAADVPAEIEVYAGAMHGWCPPDSQVYNKAQAERAWSRLLVLFEEALAAPG